MSFMGSLFGTGNKYTPPPPPDPWATANAQAVFGQKAGQQTQQLNMIDQSSPYGSMNYVQSGLNPDGSPRYTLQTTLSPEQQGLYNKSVGIQGQEGDLASSLLSAKRGALSGNPLDLSENATETRLNQLWHGQNDPLIAAQRESTIQGLYNRGVREGDPAYDIAMRNFNDTNSRSANQFLMGAHQLGTSDIMNEYNSPLNTLQSIQGTWNPTMPTQSSTPTTNVAAPDYMGMVNNNYDQMSKNDYNAYTADTAKKNAAMGGLFGLGQAAITAMNPLGSIFAPAKKSI